MGCTGMIPNVSNRQYFTWAQAVGTRNSNNTPGMVAACMVDIAPKSEYVAVVTWRLGDVILHQSCRGPHGLDVHISHVREDARLMEAPVECWCRFPGMSSHIPDGPVPLGWIIPRPSNSTQLLDPTCGLMCQLC